MSFKELSEIPFYTSKKRDKMDIKQIEEFKEKKRIRVRKGNLENIMKSCSSYFGSDITFEKFNEDTSINQVYATLAFFHAAQDYEYTFQEMCEFLNLSFDLCVYFRHNLLIYWEESSEFRVKLKNLEVPVYY